MDTVHEETSPPPSPLPPNHPCYEWKDPSQQQQLALPSSSTTTATGLLSSLNNVQQSHQQYYNPSENNGGCGGGGAVGTLPSNFRLNDSSDVDNNSLLSSRRPSAIIAALRRPSQALALSAAHAVMNQRRYLLGLFNNNSERSIAEKEDVNPKEEEIKMHNRRMGQDSLTIILSALYAKLLIVLGMAFPITEIISKDVQAFFYQGFYLYLYLGSILFVVYVYAKMAKEKAVITLMNSYNKDQKQTIQKTNNVVRYGSFYLRLGAIAFGIGSMVYSGLEFGRYFELRNNVDCHSNVLQAITPATRMLLTLFQVQFLFLNNKEMDMSKQRIVARFGLMHMIGTNLCEWLLVLVEETKHEILNLSEHHNSTNSSLHHKYCQEEGAEGTIMGSLVANASPFLFPCTIEYSLICAVILSEMWKKVRTVNIILKEKANQSASNSRNPKNDRIAAHYAFNPFGGSPVTSNHHFTVDCSNAHKGLFAGIMVIVLTIISLIMFFVLANEQRGTEKSKDMAEFEVAIVELVLYVITTVAVIVAMVQMRKLKYDRKIKEKGQAGIGLDNTLLVVAQTGMYIYCMFSIIGCYFTMQETKTALLTEILSFIQTSLQTMFVLDGWWRRCRSLDQAKRKPGRELITFLIIANMAMWTINTLEKNRAEFRPSHLEFFGDWAWTIITHISMPLAIFYRFHSTICLFEIWKNAYKIKPQYKLPLFSYF